MNTEYMQGVSAPDEDAGYESVSSIILKARSRRCTLPFPGESLFLDDGDKAASFSIGSKLTLIKAEL